MAGRLDAEAREVSPPRASPPQQPCCGSVTDNDHFQQVAAYSRVSTGPRTATPATLQSRALGGSRPCGPSTVRWRVEGGETQLTSALCASGSVVAPASPFFGNSPSKARFSIIPLAVCSDQRWRQPFTPPAGSLAMSCRFDVRALHWFLGFSMLLASCGGGDGTASPDSLSGNGAPSPAVSPPPTTGSGKLALTSPTSKASSERGAVTISMPSSPPTWHRKFGPQEGGVQLDTAQIRSGLHTFGTEWRNA